jgi:hypothetical protein
MVNPTVLYFAIILSHFNSAINPLLYAYHLKDFRGALSQLFGCRAQQAESQYRPSLISQQQQRISEHYSARRTFEPRIYVDSPVWKRQQQQQIKLEPLKEASKSNDNDSGNMSASDTAQHNENGNDKLGSKRLPSQTKIFIISDSGNNLVCEPQSSSLYDHIVKRNRNKEDSI